MEDGHGVIGGATGDFFVLVSRGFHGVDLGFHQLDDALFCVGIKAGGVRVGRVPDVGGFVRAGVLGELHRAGSCDFAADEELEGVFGFGCLGGFFFRGGFGEHVFVGLPSFDVRELGEDDFVPVRALFYNGVKVDLPVCGDVDGDDGLGGGRRSTRVFLAHAQRVLHDMHFGKRAAVPEVAHGAGHEAFALAVGRDRLLAGDLCVW